MLLLKEAGVDRTKEKNRIHEKEENIWSRIKIQNTGQMTHIDSDWETGGGAGRKQEERERKRENLQSHRK